MEKEILIKLDDRQQNINELSEEIELLFTMIEELKEETFRQDEDIQTISDVILDTKLKTINIKQDLNIAKKSSKNLKLLQGSLFGLGLSSILYYTNSYLLIGGILTTGIYYIIKI